MIVVLKDMIAVLKSKLRPTPLDHFYWLRPCCGVSQMSWGVGVSGQYFKVVQTTPLARLLVAFATHYLQLIVGTFATSDYPALVDRSKEAYCVSPSLDTMCIVCMCNMYVIQIDKPS